MAYFQTPGTVSFGPVKYPLGVWPENAAGYRLYVRGNSGVEMIGIETGQTLTLQLTGGRSLRIESEETRDARRRGGAARPSNVTVKNEVATSDLHVFTVQGTAPGSAVLYAIDGHDRPEAELLVSVGKFGNHPRMDVDLIADVMRGNDSTRIHALQRMLHDNPDNIFNQKSGANEHRDKPRLLTCGMVAHDRGLQVFGKSTMVTHDWYTGAIYAPLKEKVRFDRKNLRYLPAKVASLAAKVGARLRAGEAVRLAVVDAPDLLTPINGKLVAYYDGGHTVLAVGCNADNSEFLYIDPFYNGSKLQYGGGHALNSFGETSQSLGIMALERDTTRLVDASDARPNIMRTKDTTYGTFNPINGTRMEVVAGPFAGF